jgi:uncharacterized tellurite resistance protein B-like protein
MVDYVFPSPPSIGDPMFSKTAKAPNHSVQTLLTILIGAAWIDGKVQREEQEYLCKIAQAEGVADDPAIYPLLHGLRKIDQQQCYQAVQDYLGDRPTRVDCQELLEAISGLIYSDGDVGTEEAKLLTKIQEIELNCDGPGPCSNNLPDLIQRLYQRWVAVLDHTLPS